MHSEDRRGALELMQRLAATSVGKRLILGGSSGIWAVSEGLPALTEDIDFVVDADWVAGHADALLAELRALGFDHLEGTCSFTTPEGHSIDLVGYSESDTIDRIGGAADLPVMVFGDLSILLKDRAATIEVPGGGHALSPAALAASKLLTIRLEKGSKDKLQALLIIEENAGDASFLEDLGRLLARFEPDRIGDAVADAHTALLTISTDGFVADAQAIGYTELRAAASRGFDLLSDLAERRGWPR